jgi:hypothetical protein
MGRITNLDYALRKRLHEMYQPGMSKNQCQKETASLRNKYKTELINSGVSRTDAHYESLQICTYKDVIFSKSTLDNYTAAINPFVKFVEEIEGTKRVTVEGCVKYVQPFIDSRAEAGLSPATVKRDLAAVCKALGKPMADYRRPPCHYAERRKGLGESPNRESNQKLHGDILELNRCLGLRRSELGRLKISDIKYRDDGSLEAITRRGKGGKRNVNLVTDPGKISYIEKFVDAAIDAGRDYLLAKDALNHNSDLHSERANAAKDRYREVVDDMNQNPGRREFYTSEIRRMFAEAGRTLNEDLDRPYECRGYNRVLLRQRGIPHKWDRVAVLYTSLTILSHFRSSVTVNHYLTR